MAPAYIFIEVRVMNKIPTLPDISRISSKTKQHVNQVIVDVINNVSGAIESVYPESAHLTIPITGWEISNTTGYGYQIDLDITKVVDGDDRVDVVFTSDLDKATACGIRPITETLENGKLRMWSMSIPEEPLEAEMWITYSIDKTNVQKGD